MSIPSGEGMAMVTEAEEQAIPWRHWRSILARPGVAELLIFLAAALCFIVSAGFPFLFDDRAQVLANPELRSWGGTLSYFASDVWHSYDLHMVTKYYRPLFYLWFRGNYLLFHLHPAGWHIAEVLLHGVVSVLAFRAAARLAGSRSAGAVAGLLFAVHPAHIESVAWVSGVTDPLMSLFLLAALLLFLRWQREGGALPLALSALCYALALLCKEPALMLLPLLALLLWLEPRAGGAARRWMPGLLPFGALSLAYFAVRSLLHLSAGSVNSLPWRTVLLSVPELLLFYLRQSLVPVGLSVTYDFAPQLAPDAGFWLALLPLLAVAGAYACWCARSPRHRRALTVAAAVWLLWLLPVLNLRLLDPAQAIHDRYLYLPLFGLCLAAGVAFRQWSARAPGAEQQAALAVAVVAALLLTAAQVQQMDWSSELLLWSRAARIAPHNDVALSNLGAVLCERGNIPEGMAVFQRELEANPNSWNASYNLGYALYGEHQYAAAEPWVQRALRLRPESAQTLRLMGGIQLRLGRLAAAEHYMRDALSLSPREEDFHTALGLVLLQKGDRAGATHEFMEELRLFPGSQSASRALDQARGESAR